MKIALEKLIYECEQPVAWGDMDAFGHVNNVVYARYFETARARFFSEQGYWDDPGKPEKEGVILIGQQLRYRKQVRFPETLKIKVGISQVSSRGFTMQCAMFDSEGDVACEAEGNILWINFQTGKPARLPQEFRQIQAK